MHRRAIHASTIYIQSSLLGARSCHPTHAGIITVFSVHPSSAYVRACELKSETAELRAADDIASSHHSLITCFLFPLVALIKADILAVMYRFSFLQFLNFCPHPECQNLNKRNCHEAILLASCKRSHCSR